MQDLPAFSPASSYPITSFANRLYDTSSSQFLLSQSFDCLDHSFDVLFRALDVLLVVGVEGVEVSEEPELLHLSREGEDVFGGADLAKSERCQHMCLTNL